MLCVNQPLEFSLQLQECVQCYCAIATYCLHVELPMSGSEEGGSQLTLSNENVFMLCFVCSQLGAEQGNK
jgi:hypothetical protein